MIGCRNCICGTPEKYTQYARCRFYNRNICSAFAKSSLPWVFWFVLSLLHLPTVLISCKVNHQNLCEIFGNSNPWFKASIIWGTEKSWIELFLNCISMVIHTLYIYTHNNWFFGSLKHLKEIHYIIAHKDTFAEQL